MQFIDLAQQLNRIRPDVDRRIAQVLEHGQFIMGPEVQSLERVLAEIAQVPHCVAVANGTDALQIALMALGIGLGDEVITPAFTYIAAVEAIVLLGAKPVLVDIDPVSFNISPEAVSASVSPNTKAILAVDLFGQCAPYRALSEIADPLGIHIIEDGAQSFGASQSGKAACSFGQVATTSFFPSKPLGCFGDGGACFTSDDDLAALIKSIRAHGQAERYRHVRLGVNSRLDSLQAAILLAKTPILEDEIVKRQAVASRYETLGKEAGLPERGIKFPQIMDGNLSAWAQYTIRVPQRETIRRELEAEGIPTTIHYPHPIHHQPAFSSLAIPAGGLRNSEKAASEVLSLPMHPYLEETDQARVIDALASITERLE